MNPWHDINTGIEAPEIVNAIIEIPKGSKGKYEIHKEYGLIKLDRVLYSSVHYPANYGFIPKTLCGDKDPLDILVITSIELPILCLVEARVIGVMRMTDQGESDDKIIAVAHKDVSMSHIQDLADLPPHSMREIKRFFEDYKILENKKVLVEPILNKQEALKIVEESMLMYKKIFGQ